MSPDLVALLDAAYGARVLKTHDLPPLLHDFVVKAISSPDLIAEARAELDRLQSLPAGRCFASAHQLDFLRDALAHFDRLTAKESE